MDDNETDKVIIGTLAKNTRSIAILYAVMNDFACLVEASLERCCGDGCATSATVEQVDLGVRMCDACASRTMCRAISNLDLDRVDGLNVFRACVADENRWRDLPDAERIRRVQGYVDFLRAGDEPEPPREQGRLH